MKKHLDQAKHNEDFLSVIHKHSPTNYFDWKVTVIFYSALHHIRALEKHSKKHIGGTHQTILKNINPAESSAIMPVDSACFGCYDDLYNLAHISRYTGIVDVKMFLPLMEFNYGLAQKHLLVIKKYCNSKGVKIV
ncbi:MAG: hypothetical protein K8R85_05965 [Bacteroidetes bacterium]|nr:hypothetical protein [Bacteroidota bacterium]